MLDLLQRDVVSRDESTVWRCVLELIAQGRTPLHEAAARGWARLCADMIDRGADVTTVDNVGYISSSVCHFSSPAAVLGQC